MISFSEQTVKAPVVMCDFFVVDPFVCICTGPMLVAVSMLHLIQHKPIALDETAKSRGNTLTQVNQLCQENAKSRSKFQ